MKAKDSDSKNMAKQKEFEQQRLSKILERIIVLLVLLAMLFFLMVAAAVSLFGLN